MTLVFLANCRLPTEKAHGIAIVKQCEAFADLGVEVELWHPRRHQTDAALRGRDVLRYYGIPEGTFRVRTLPNVDVVRLERLPRWLYLPLFVVHEWLWGALVAGLVRRRRATLSMTREVAVAWWLARFGVPAVLDVHVVGAGIRRRFLRGLGRSSTTSFVALTEGNRRGLADLGVPGDRIVVSGSAVDPAPFASLPDRAECRRLLGLPADRPIVGYIGRFQTFGEDKGISQLVRAVAALSSSSVPAPLLVLVGGPVDDLPRYRELAVSAGLAVDDLVCPGPVPPGDVPRWARALDVGAALYPKTAHMAQFASPLKVFEYLAAGAAVVASDLPAMREALAGARRVAFVDPDDPAAVAAAIGDLLTRADEPSVPEHVPTWDERARLILGLAAARGAVMGP